jgi:F-type H+-transporting ATPase subunit delta
MTEKNEYGTALFMLAKEEGVTDRVREDIETAYLTVKNNPEYVKLIDTPALAKSEKQALIDEAFGSLHYSVVNLLKILCEKHAVYSFSQVFSTYSALYDEMHGIERVEAVTAILLSDEQKRAIAQKLESMISKTVVIKNTTDPKMLCGVMLRYSGKQLDGSVRSRLDAFSESLKKLNL